MIQYIGVDVASGTLEVGVSQQRKTRRFANTPDGIKALGGWLEDIRSGTEQQVILEPTSTYHQHLVEAMVQWGIPYTLINPAHTAAFARVQGRRAKTDPVDAHFLAAYGESQQPRPSPQPDTEQEQLKSLRRHREWLDRELRATRNRLETARRSPWASPSVLESLERTIRGLEEELGHIAEEEEQVVQQSPRWAHQVALLRTIPGVGKKTAIMLLSELPPVSRCPSAKTWVAFCGISPEPRESGKAQWSRLSRMGSPRIRAVLYMAAVSALRWNPQVRALGERLRSRSKPGKVRVLAAANKLLRTCFGVLKHQQPYDLNWRPPDLLDSPG